jgi:hypothetical protein
MSPLGGLLGLAIFPSPWGMGAGDVKPLSAWEPSWDRRTSPWRWWER